MNWKVAPTYENWDIESIDEAAHKATVSCNCFKCGGTGSYAWFGVCFRCSGTGKERKIVKAYTPEEYERYMKAQARAKEKRVEKEKERQQNLKDKSEENKAELLAKWGFDAENPCIYVVFGENTYSIKDEIKTRGGRYNPAFGWHFTRQTEVPAGYSLIPIAFDDVYDWLPMVKRFEIKETAKQVVEDAKNALLPSSKSEFIGELKERIRGLKVTLTGARAVSSPYGTSIMFTFKQEDNELVWFTSCPPDEKDAIVGHEYSLIGTVKDHKTYHGVKQTYLNRCILKELVI